MITNSQYSDIDLSFRPHPGQVSATGKGDIVPKINEAAVKNSIRNLINFDSFSKPFNHEIATNVRRLLFDNVDILTASLLKRSIGNIISTYEPRVVINDISVELDHDSYGAKFFIDFTVINQSNPTKLEIRIDRVR